MVNTLKLRDKHRALCAQKNEISSQDSTAIVMDSDTIEVDESGSCSAQNEILPETPGTINEDDRNSAARSTYSISKNIKSMLGGQSIPKKDKMKLRRELFRRKLNISIPTEQDEDEDEQMFEQEERLRMSEDDSPRPEPRKNYLLSRVKTITKSSNQPRRGFMKRQTRELAKNVDIFRNLLKKKRPDLSQD